MTIDRFKEILQCCIELYPSYDDELRHEALTKLMDGINSDDTLKYKIFQIIKDIKE